MSSTPESKTTSPSPSPAPTSLTIYPSPPPSPPLHHHHHHHRNADLKKIFNEALLISIVLGKTKRELSPPETTAPVLSEEMSRSRAYLDSLAFLCDYSERGRSVTSIALAQNNRGIMYHFACNHGTCTIHVRAFITKILVVPASSYNAYIRWALPPDPGMDLEEHERMFLRKTTQVMRKKILNDLAGKRERLGEGVIHGRVVAVSYERVCS